MRKVRRNVPCPCGSGLKYKRCCARKKVSRSAKSVERHALKGLKPAMRMKGGIRYDEQEKGFFAIVHTWDNMLGYGEPEEWRSSERFVTEEAAMRHYKTTIRPALQEMMAEMKKDGDTRGIYRQLE